jgi:hypothetical protein
VFDPARGRADAAREAASVRDIYERARSSVVLLIGYDANNQPLVVHRCSLSYGRSGKRRVGVVAWSVCVPEQVHQPASVAYDLDESCGDPIDRIGGSLQSTL